MSRSLRRAGAALLAAALLLAQLATAAYACPLLDAAATTSTAMAPDMPCAEMLASGRMADDAGAGLCAEHCKAGTQGVEPAQALALPMAPPPSAPVPGATPATGTAPWAAHERRRERAPPIAHSILHCCYRL